MIGETFAHFRMIRRLGGGRTGDVYQAEDLRFGRHVAVKLLQPSVCRDLHALEELRRETQAVSALRHPHICTVEEVDEYDDRYFIVMELLGGEPLSAMLTGRPMDVPLLLDVGTQIADALSAAHGAGVVHRYLRPSNVYVTVRGQVKLLDFGIARAACITPDRRYSLPVDVLAYLSPEQLLGHELDGRADVFAFGVVLYEMATGRLPFSGRNAKEIIAAVLHASPERAGRLNPLLPTGVDWAAHRALEKNRASRYQSIEEVRADLARVLHSSHADPPQSAVSYPVRWQ
ncbi:MAG TPA: serine/threonine-protein kinase [Vicinamibacterales bacterium]|nr:serine/threonine-protein kinase [Vicinamibacterales bacterium]